MADIDLHAFISDLLKTGPSQLGHSENPEATPKSGFTIDSFAEGLKLSEPGKGAIPDASLVSDSSPITTPTTVPAQAFDIDTFARGLLKDNAPGVADVAPQKAPKGMPKSLAEVPHFETFKAMAAKYDVPLSTVLGLANAEGSFNSQATSPTGVVGIMQTTKKTTRDMGLDPSQRHVPEVSIEAGVKYLRYLADKQGMDLNDPHSVVMNYTTEAGGATPAYVKKVGGFKKHYEGLLSENPSGQTSSSTPASTTPGAFTIDAFTQNLGIKKSTPGTRGYAGQIASGLAEGAVIGAPEMFAKAGSVLDIPGSESALEYVKSIQKSSPSLQAKDADEEGLKKWFYEGAKSFSTSVTVGGVGAAAGAVGGAPGAVAGALVSGPVTYALSEYYDFMKDAEAAGLKREDVKDKAIQSALVEGGLELASNLVLGKIIGLVGAGKITKDAGKGLIRRFGETYLKVVGEELPTEAAQNYLETSLRQEAGIPGMDPAGAAIESMPSTMVASLGFGLMGTAAKSRQAKAAQNQQDAKEVPVNKSDQATLDKLNAALSGAEGAKEGEQKPEDILKKVAKDLVAGKEGEAGKTEAKAETPEDVIRRVLKYTEGTGAQIAGTETEKPTDPDKAKPEAAPKSLADTIADLNISETQKSALLDGLKSRSKEEQDLTAKDIEEILTERSSSYQTSALRERKVAEAAAQEDVSPEAVKEVRPRPAPYDPEEAWGMLKGKARLLSEKRAAKSAEESAQVFLDEFSKATTMEGKKLLIEKLERQEREAAQAAEQESKGAKEGLDAEISGKGVPGVAGSALTSQKVKPPTPYEILKGKASEASERRKKGGPVPKVVVPRVGVGSGSIMPVASQKPAVDAIQKNLSIIGETQKPEDLSEKVITPDGKKQKEVDAEQVAQIKKDLAERAAKKAEKEVKQRSKTTYDFSSTQVDLPEKSASKIKDMASRIPDSEIYTDPKDPSFGREESPHVTVKYGLHTSDSKEVESIVKGNGPITAKLGKVSIFENDDFDVVKAEVESPQLHALNKKIAEGTQVTDTYQDYKPHVTIAYVKKGEGKKYVGDKSLEGTEITFDSITFSSKDGKKYQIDLSQPTPKPLMDNSLDDFMAAFDEAADEYTKDKEASSKAAVQALQAAITPASPSAPTATQKLKSAAEHLQDILAGAKKINKIFGEEGSVKLGGEELDQTKWQQIRPVLSDMLTSAKAAAMDLKEFARIVVQALSPQARPYFKKFMEEESEGSSKEQQGETAKSSRFEAGNALTVEEKKKVLETVTDVYKENNLQKESKGDDARGEEIFGYPHRPDLFMRSDITGSMLRYYIRMPDGKIAHPSELYPEMKQSDIDEEMLNRQRKEEDEKYTEKSKLARVVEAGAKDQKQEANIRFNRTNRKRENSFFMQNDKGDIVRAEDGDDADFYKARGFEKSSVKVSDVETVPKTKEPWEMTLDEFIEERIQKVRDSKPWGNGQPRFKRQLEENERKKALLEWYENNEKAYIEGKNVAEKPSWAITAEDAAKRSDDILNDDFRIAHGNWIKQAVSEGKPVPQEVIADYPDLVGSKNNADKQGPTPPPPDKPGLQDFGQKLGGARKDLSASITRDMTDDDIASMPLIKIWPKSDIDSIEDISKAALATSIRAEIPSKPQKGYKLRRWVDSVKMVKTIMTAAEEKGADFILGRMNEYPGLSKVKDKIEVLKNIPREYWGRIGDVWNHPTAYTYDSEGKQVPSPYAAIEVDGMRFKGKDLEEAGAKVRQQLEGQQEAPETKMKFEVRGREGAWGINKKGDPLYRKLITFPESKEALDYIRSNHDALVQAWEDLKERENVKETDVRSNENRPRVGTDHRKGKSATPEMFTESLGFRGVEFGNWVSQGKNLKERQGMLDAAYDALMDLADILGIPSRAISLDGTLGLGLGSRGHGWASAHYEPGTLVINLTKTRGAGSLAHEWLHAVDNYFQRQRDVNQKNDSLYITQQPETQYVSKTTGHSLAAARFKELSDRGSIKNPDDWKPVEGVRPEVEEAFSELVKALDASPMHKRSALIDKGKSGGYWSRILERAARAFENYIIAKMQQKGYHNDYLANVVSQNDFARDIARYPYLLESELAPIEKAFDNLFATIQTKETSKGIAMFAVTDGNAGNAGATASGWDSTGPGETFGLTVAEARAAIAPITSNLAPILKGGIEVVQHPSELPASVRNQNAEHFNREGGSRVAGVYVWDEDKIYLVAGNIMDATQAERYALHEIVGHKAIETILGATGTRFFLDLYAAKESDMGAIARRWGIEDLTTQAGQITVASEWLAEVAADGRQNEKGIKAWWDELVTLMKGALRRIGFSIQVTDAEIAALLRVARDYTFAKQTGKATRKGEIILAKGDAYSLKDAPDQSIGWTDNRIEREIQTVVYPDDRTKGMVAWINPNDFIAATTPDELAARKIKNKSGNLEIDKLKRESQTPFLYVDDSGNGILKIVDHEGRHRLAAMAEAGITSVPIVLDFRKPADRKRMQSIKLFGQFDGSKTATVNNAIPLNWGNKDLIKQAMLETQSPSGFAQFSVAFDKPMNDLAAETEAQPRAVKEAIFGKDTDLREVRDAWRIPSWLAKKSEIIKRLLSVQTGRDNKRTSMTHDSLTETVKAFDLNKADTAVLSKVAFQLEGKKVVEAAKFKQVGEYTIEVGRSKEVKKMPILALNEPHYEKLEAFLKGQGVRPNIIEAYMGIRRLLDQSQIVVYDRLRNLKKIDPTLIDEFRTSLGNVHNYFPHSRYGNFYIQAIDPNAKAGEVGVKYRQHFNALNWRDANRWWGKNKERVIAELEKERPETNWRALEWKGDKIKGLPEEIFDFPIPIDAIQQVLDAAVDRIPAESDEARKALRTALSEESANIMKSRGFGSHFIKRKNVPGFEQTDIKRVVYDYVVGYTGWITKIEAAHDFGDVLKDLNAKQRPNEYKYAVKYVHDMLQNSTRTDKWVSNAKSFFFLNYLGFNLKTAVVNLTQNIVAGMPRLSMETKSSTATAQYFRALKDIRVSITEGGIKSKKGFTDDEHRFLNDMFREGWGQSQFIREISSQLGSPGSSSAMKQGSQIWQKAIRYSGLPMEIAERYNRLSLGLASYRIARDGKINNDKTLVEFGLKAGQKGGFEASKKFAEGIVTDAHFIYGKTNMPSVMRGSAGAKALTTAYTFRTFNHNLISLWRWMLTDGGKRGKMAFAYSILGIVALGGLSALPFYGTLAALIRQLFGEDYLGTEVRKFIPDHQRDLVMYGAPSVLGINIGGSLGMSLPIFDRMKTSQNLSEQVFQGIGELVGIPGAILKEVLDVVDAVRSGRSDRAIEVIAPTFLRNIAQAERLRSEGQTTLAGKPINLPGERGARKITDYEAAAKVLGFQPLSSTKSYETYKILQDLAAYKQSKQSEFANEYMAAKNKGNVEKMMQVRENVRKWNQKMIEAGTPEHKIDLQKSIAARSKTAKPPKALRGEAKELRELFK
jgi:2'-5' RNA ligase